MKKLCLFQTVGCVVNVVSALRFVIVSVCLCVRTIDWLEINGLLNIQSAYALDMVNAATRNHTNSVFMYPKRRTFWFSFVIRS